MIPRRGLILVLAAAACSPRMEPHDVVAIEGYIFDRESFFTDVVEARFVALTSADRKKVVQEFARRKIVTQEAEKRNILQDKTDSLAQTQMKEDLLLARVLEEEVWSGLLSDSSLKVLYDRMGREIVLDHILVTFKGPSSSPTELTEEDALGVVRQIRKKLLSGEMEFSEAARRYSEDPSRTRGGAMGEFRWGELPEPIQSAAFSLNESELSPPIRSQTGYHLVRVRRITDRPLQDFREMLPELREFIRSNKGHEFDLALEEFEAELKQRYRLGFNPDVINGVFLDMRKRHGEKEGHPSASLILEVDVPGIVCLTGGENLELDWFQEKMAMMGPLISDTPVDSEDTLISTLERLVYRYLTLRYAGDTRDVMWHTQIEEMAKTRRYQILQNALLNHMREERPGQSDEELMQWLVDRYRVRINTEFITTFRMDETEI